MASISMSSSARSLSTAATPNVPSKTAYSSAKAAASSPNLKACRALKNGYKQTVKTQVEEAQLHKRKALFSGAALAVAMWAGNRAFAFAEEEKKAEANERKQPKPGSPEALAQYYRVCRTMPTARICHN